MRDSTLAAKRGYLVDNGSAMWIRLSCRPIRRPFFGYSDNTNLLVYLWNLGIIGFYRGSTMVHLARPGRLHPMTLESMPGAEYVYRVLLGMGERGMLEQFGAVVVGRTNSFRSGPRPH